MKHTDYRGTLFAGVFRNHNGSLEVISAASNSEYAVQTLAARTAGYLIIKSYHFVNERFEQALREYIKENSDSADFSFEAVVHAQK